MSSINMEVIEMVRVCVNSGLTSLSTIFQSYHDAINSLFCSAASLKYHVPDT